MIDWIVALIEKASKKEIHIFSLDFASALMANILHSTSSHEFLLKHPKFTKGLMTKLLKMLKDNIPTSVLMHLLICLSYLNKEKF
jgi:membrane-associated PAP2 superfamily phosphatase